MPRQSGDEERRGLSRATPAQAMPRGPSQPGPHRGLGKAVRFLREEAKVTQAALAEKAGVSASSISRIEAAEVDPTWGSVRKLAAALGVSIEFLAEAAERFDETDV